MKVEVLGKVVIAAIGVTAVLTVMTFVDVQFLKSDMKEVKGRPAVVQFVDQKPIELEATPAAVPVKVPVIRVSPTEAVK